MQFPPWRPKSIMYTSRFIGMTDSRRSSIIVVCVVSVAFTLVVLVSHAEWWVKLVAPLAVFALLWLKIAASIDN